MSDDQTIFRAGISRAGRSFLFQSDYLMKNTSTHITNISEKMINIFSV
jgi:hypothetical protein